MGDRKLYKDNLRMYYMSSSYFRVKTEEPLFW
jgi:hypothetical protein